MVGNATTDEQSTQRLIAYEPLIDVRSILAATYRNRWLIAVAMLVCLTLAAAYILISPKTYEATAKVQIGLEAPSPLLQPSANNPAPQDVDRSLQTEMDLLGTRDMASLALRQLAANPRLAVIARRYSADDLQDSMTYYLPKSSRVVSISIRDKDPGAAAAIANAYADALIFNGLQARLDATAASRDYLGGQLQLAKSRLEQSERALVGYARAAGVLDASEGSSTGQGLKSLAASDLVQINSAYAQARATRILAQQRWEQAQHTPAMSMPEVLANTAVQDLTQQRAALEAKLQENRQRYGNSYPAVRQATNNIAALDHEIAAIAGNVRNSIRDQYAVAARQEAALGGEVGQLKGETLDEQDRAVRYNILFREADTNRQLYEALLQRYKEVSAEVGLTSSNILVAERAHPPTLPVAPKATKILLLAIVAGLLLSILLVFLRERLDRRVGDPESLAEATGLPLLGVISRLKDNVEPGEAIRDADSHISETAHSIRASIGLRSRGAEPGALLLTSTKADEGKSTTALALAHAYADAGERVLVIDGDLRRPSLHTLFGIQNRVGFADVLEGKLALREATKKSDAYRVDVLTTGSRPESPASLLNPEKVRAVLSQAASLYDRIIVDGPPTLGIADASLLGAAADSTVFVVKSEGASRHEIQVALGRLEAEGINVTGAILTMYEPQLLNRGYSYTYPPQEAAVA